MNYQYVGRDPDTIIKRTEKGVTTYFCGFHKGAWHWRSEKEEALELRKPVAKKMNIVLNGELIPKD